MNYNDLPQWKYISENLDLNDTDPVVVAMSGGVDSSVCAVLLKILGYQVIGMTLRLYDAASHNTKACCAGRDINDAKNIAELFDFPHYVLDYREKFRTSVVTNFVHDYLEGKTPIPCITCNETVKFQDMFDSAKKIGAQALVTGHYVLRQQGPPAYLQKNIHNAKDQTYFLFSTSQEQINFLRFPLGSLTKEETRLYATRFGLPIAKKPDSQDICFIPDGNYAQFIETFYPQHTNTGNIIDSNGKKLGEHQGLHAFTVGQRRGLKIGYHEALYVLEIKPETNEVIVGPYEALAIQTLKLDNISRTAYTPQESFSCVVQLRSTAQPVEALIEPQGHSATVSLRSPQYGIAKGQACVFYDSTGKLLGGGKIASTQNCLNTTT